MKAYSISYFSGTGSQNTCELYDPETESWTTIDSMNYERQQHTASTLTNGQILVAGGETYTLKGELFNL